MWALVQSNQVVAVYSRPKAVTIGGVQHPAAIFSVWSKAQKKDIGIYDYVEVGANPDSKYYNLGTGTTVIDNDAGTVTKTYTNNAKNLDDVNEVDENGDALLDENGDQLVTLGVKSVEKARIKTIAAGLLQSSDWMIIREAEGGTAVASDIATYRAAVRTKSNSMETAIDGAADTDAMIALYTNTYHANGAIDTVATLQDWPAVPAALK
jgi:hypothetical protein